MAKHQARSASNDAPPDEDGNSVRLVGRVAAAPESRRLPSGDTLTSWRMVVRRSGAPPGRPSVDTIDCVAWPAVLRRRVNRWESGDRVEVSGALRRRFWRTATGPASRYEVEVATVHRIDRAQHP